MSKNLFTALVGAAMLFSANVYAQSGSQAAQPMAAQQQQTDFSAEKKSKFATAYTQVRELEKEFTEQLKGVSGQDEAQALQQQAQQEMIEAVQSAGLSVDMYNQIVAAMRQDESLRKDIQQRVQ
jgi:hypothetical protein